MSKLSRMRSSRLEEDRQEDTIGKSVGNAVRRVSRCHKDSKILSLYKISDSFLSNLFIYMFVPFVCPIIRSIVRLVARPFTFCTFCYVPGFKEDQ